MFELTNYSGNPRAYYLGARFTDDERDFIKKIAKKRNLSISDLFRIAIEKELKNDLETKDSRKKVI